MQLLYSVGMTPKQPKKQLYMAPKKAKVLKREKEKKQTPWRLLSSTEYATGFTVFSIVQSYFTF